MEYNSQCLSICSGMGRSFFACYSDRICDTISNIFILHPYHLIS